MRVPDSYRGPLCWICEESGRPWIGVGLTRQSARTAYLRDIVARSRHNRTWAWARQILDLRGERR
jgi:hypothetical protein